MHYETEMLRITVEQAAGDVEVKMKRTRHFE